MSEKNNSRTRRRASRSAGPPIDDLRTEALSASDTDRSDAVEARSPRTGGGPGGGGG